MEGQRADEGLVLASVDDEIFVTDYKANEDGIWNILQIDSAVLPCLCHSCHTERHVRPSLRYPPRHPPLSTLPSTMDTLHIIFPHTPSPGTQISGKHPTSLVFPLSGLSGLSRTLNCRIARSVLSYQKERLLLRGGMYCCTPTGVRATNHLANTG